jgi:hypothetical protein
MSEKNDNPGENHLAKERIEIQAVAEPNTKRRGESAEAEFISRAISLGFSVLKPWGESDRYDVVIDHGSGFWRVQVKCSTCRVGQHFRLELSRKGVCYTQAEIDFVAGNVVPLDLWYIVPIEACAGKSGMHLRPQGRGTGQYEKYLEAWCLLDCTRQARGWMDIPPVCRCPQLPVRCAVCPLRG